VINGKEDNMMKSILVALMLCVSCIECAAAQGEAMEGYVTDRYVGTTEQWIVRKFGRPKEVSVHSLASLKGTTLYPIGKGLFARPKTDARLLYYENKNGTRYIWLKKISNTWAVVSDVWIAPGVQF
jgi:hypothetical protein